MTFYVRACGRARQQIDRGPDVWERTFVPSGADPRYTREELERQRRSIAMLQPGSMAMRREDAMRVLSQLGAVEERLARLRSGLQALLEEAGSSR